MEKLKIRIEHQGFIALAIQGLISVISIGILKTDLKTYGIVSLPNILWFMINSVREITRKEDLKMRFGE